VGRRHGTDHEVSSVTNENVIWFAQNNGGNFDGGS